MGSSRDPTGVSSGEVARPPSPPFSTGEPVRFIIIVESDTTEDTQVFADELAENINHIYAEDVQRVEVIVDHDGDMYDAF
jgi:hypothetical protein